MGEEGSPSQTRNRQSDAIQSGERLKRTSGSRMRARTWVIAHHYHEQEEYGIPAIPDWTVVETDRNGVAFAENDETEPFIRADEPMRVRR